MKSLRDYIITRVLLTIPMLFVLVTLVFIVVRIMPGDPVEAMLRPGVPQEYKDQIRHNLGLDRPLFFNLRGSSARVSADRLFLQTEPGAGGHKVLLVEGDTVMAISNRRKEAGDWVQVVVPENFQGWVSPDQMDWMRQVNVEMTVLEEKEIQGSETWTTFTTADGLAGDEVNAIWAEASGVVWFGTDNGISRYSATGWDIFDDTIGQDIQVVWSGRPADLWFGTDGDGAIHLRSGRMTSFTTADGLGDDHVHAIWGQGSRTVWAGTDRGASLYDGETWTAFTAADGLGSDQVRAIWGDRNAFWFGTDSGLSRYDGEAWTTFTAADGLADDRVNAVWGDGTSVLWVGTDNGLSRYEDDTWTTFTAADGLAGDHVNVIWGDEAELWVGTDGGASRFDGEGWVSFTTADGLAEGPVRAISKDNSGVPWIGAVGGLSQYENLPWIKLSVPAGGMEGWAPADQFAIRINPLDSQYFNYLWDLIRLDLGESLAPTRGRPIALDLKVKFPATLELSIFSLLITVVIGVSTGVYAAHKRRSVADYTFRIYSIVIYAVPVFWLGLMLQLVFGVYLKDWYETSAVGQSLRTVFGDFLPLPISGRIGTGIAPKTITGLFILDSILTRDKEALVSAIRHLLLPSITLGLYLSGVFTRLTRSNMLDVLREDYITAARARGIRERAVIWKHALKNAFIPVLTMMGLQFAGLMAGAVLTETTFSWPGMGLFMWERIGYRDFPSIQGGVVFFAVLVTTVSLLVDIIYAAIDPRIRY
jgi:peptide/nickel transport system permease protein